MLRLPYLSTDIGHNNDWQDKKSEIELKTVDMSVLEDRSSQIILKESQLLTPEMLFGIFYKYKPVVLAVDESEEKLPDAR